MNALKKKGPPPAPTTPPGRQQPADRQASASNSTSATQATQRWPANCVEDGEWIQLPKVILKQFPKLGLSSQHLLLLLVLQCDRYRDRPHRYFWEQLGDLCGCSKNTVRRWGYELQRKGMLNIIPVTKSSPDEPRTIGFRNSRSIFDLEPFEERVDALHAAWVAERDEKKSAKRKKRTQ